jgi:predicted short-subunit dehydrogenase-like oxidoreductase (DUF2520 family)
MRISFVGSGNVAWHMAQALEQAGHHIVEVFSRDQRNARKLANMLYDTDVAPDLNFSESDTELVVLAVKDDALPQVMEQLVLPEKCLLVHTSGTSTLDDLRRWVRIYSDVQVSVGVFYPLQTFSKDIAIDFADVPLCIEGAGAHTEEILANLAHDVSNRVYLVNSEERRALHVGAVFACNFSNHLLAIAKQLLDAESLDFDLLKPLIQETFRKALEAHNPAQVQTGPARRGDRHTMNRHLDYLENSPAYARLYEILSDSIERMYR